MKVVRRFNTRALPFNHAQRRRSNFIALQCCMVFVVSLSTLMYRVQGQALGYTTPLPPVEESSGLTPAEEILERAGVEGIEAKLAEIMEGCDVDMYNQLSEEVLEEYTTDNDVCFQVVDDLRRRQFGPPSEWEIFKVTCRGPCFDNYHRVTEVYEAAGCSCGQFEEYQAFLDLVEWERPVPPCLQYNTDHLCKQLQICNDPHLWFRHGCRGCGWEARHEDQWREERDPDFGCGAASMPASMMLPIVAALCVMVAAWYQQMQ